MNSMNRKSRLFSGFVSLCTAIVLFCAGAPVRADEMKVRITNYISSMDLKQKGETLAGPYLRRGLGFTDKGEVFIYRNEGLIEITMGKGSFQGEATWQFEDGTTAVMSFEGTLEAGYDRKLKYDRVEAKFTRGSGRFEGISGTLVLTGRSLTPFEGETRSDAYFDGVATYTLPKK